MSKKKKKKLRKKQRGRSLFQIIEGKQEAYFKLLRENKTLTSNYWGKIRNLLQIIEGK